MPYHPRMSASALLTLAFAACLLAGLAVKFWLASRQVRHVAQHRDAVRCRLVDQPGGADYHSFRGLRDGRAVS